MVPRPLLGSYDTVRVYRSYRKPIVISIATATLCIFLLLFFHTKVSPPIQTDVEEIHGHIESRIYDSDTLNIPKTLLSRDYLAGGHKTKISYAQDLEKRIQELERIKLSLSNELREILRAKDNILNENAALAKKGDVVLSSINRNKRRLKQLEIDIASAKSRKFEEVCNSDRIAPIVISPLKSVDIDEVFPIVRNKSTNSGYTFNHINQQFQVNQRYFDLSLCPLTNDFKFHLLTDPRSREPTHTESEERSRIIESLLKTDIRYSDSSDGSCLSLYIARGGDDLHNLSVDKNYVIIDLTGNFILPQTANLIHAAVFSTVFHETFHKQGFDLIIPGVLKDPSDYDQTISSIPSQSPIDRKYLASYFGFSYIESRSPDKAAILSQRVLQAIHRNSIDDLFLFIYECDKKSKPLCISQREKLMELSIFTIIFLAQDYYREASEILYIALSRGAIPVVVYDPKSTLMLPFHDLLDWSRVCILINFSRLPEVHMIMRSISVFDIYQLKRQGRHVFENYLATTKQILNTVITYTSMRLFDHPSPPIQDTRTILYREAEDLKYDTDCFEKACLEVEGETSISTLSDEILGPREPPLASIKFQRNLSLTLSSQYELWNNPHYSPFYLYPNHPQDGLVPSEFKFLTGNSSFRPIGKGMGGSGLEFSQSLGGDFPNEQFTIVLLTYDRNNMLLKTLERLKNLPYLNKILVVWNGSKQPPDAKLVWPAVRVPLEIVRTERNSLNNRFLPYDSIETEAILSLDDDSPLRADEIVFAFRVWRQSRDQIVGFPGRYHAWDLSSESWLYNSNHSCELSMVLTGGAFFHKYYSYMYSYKMSPVIREIVDKYMNCEDIAMNFLVAHLTRKAPIKVTSRWTFHCVGCVNSLSEEESHFTERHECLNLFLSIYGYMPLLSTQHRSDSILFKTRLPSDKQKCFKFV